MPLGGRRVILLAPGPGLGGEAEGAAQHEAWESVLALARALLAAGADVSVEGDPYASLLVGLIAEEFLEPQAAEGRRREVSDARTDSRESTRVILRPLLEQDERLEQAFDTLSRSGVVRYERGSPESSEERPASVVALVAIGSRVARASNAVRRRRQYPNSIFITVPTDAFERTAADDVDSDIGREIRQIAEQRVTEATAEWRRRRTQRERDTPVDARFDTEDQWTKRIPHELYAQLIVDALLRRF
jgi:hypothetical protein